MRLPGLTRSRLPAVEVRQSGGWTHRGRVRVPTGLLLLCVNILLPVRPARSLALILAW